MKTIENHSLLNNNTFGINVNANYFIEYDSEQELKSLLQSDIITDNKYLHIGGGSNLLFIGDYQGVILHSNIKGIELVGEDENTVLLKVGAGEVWDEFVEYCVDKNFGGIENLSGIPGEVGASPVQNIGAYGCEVCDFIEKLDTVCIASCEDMQFVKKECLFAYRNSIFKQDLKGQYIVTYVYYRLNKNAQANVNYGSLSEEIKSYDSVTIKTARQAVLAVRNKKLPEPKVLGNAGSFYMNAVVNKAKFNELFLRYPHMPFYELPNNEYKIPSGWLIEQCGWKGKSVGKVAVHGLQALVLINKGGANGLDVINLSDSIRKSVSEKFGIDLRPEVNIIWG